MTLGEGRRFEPPEARPVELAAAHPHADGEVPPVRAPADDLAPVGDVQRHRRGASQVRRLREVRVVRAGAGQQPTVLRAGEEERRQILLCLLVGRPVRRCEKLLAPGVAPRAKRAVDALDVAGAHALPRAVGRCGPGLERGSGRRGVAVGGLDGDRGRDDHGEQAEKASRHRGPGRLILTGAATAFKVARRSLESANRGG